MKPRIRKPVSAGAVEFRVRRHLAKKGLMLVQRNAVREGGPIFVLDPRAGKVLHKGLPSFEALASLLGLIAPNERVVP